MKSLFILLFMLATIVDVKADYLYRVPNNLKQNKFSKSYESQVDIEMESVRYRQLEILRVHKPELLYNSKYSYNESETSHENLIAAITPLNQIDEFVTALNYKKYWLDENAGEVDAQNGLLELRLQRNLNMDNLIYIAPIYGFSSNVDSPGLKAGYRGKSKINYGIDILMWTPWQENTYAAKEDAREISAEFDTSYSWGLWGFNANAKIAEIYLADGPMSDERREGRDIGWLGTVSYNIININEDYMALGFRSGYKNALNEDYHNSYLQIFGNFDGSRYISAHDDVRVPREPHSLKLQIGLQGTWVLLERFAVTAKAQVGQDSLRDIEWGKLYDMQGRIYFIPRADWRIYLGSGMDSQAGNGVAKGKTSYIDLGINYIF